MTFLVSALHLLIAAGLALIISREASRAILHLEAVRIALSRQDERTINQNVNAFRWDLFWCVLLGAVLARIVIS